MPKSTVTYAPRATATSEAEICARSNVYRFVLDCHARKEATRPGSPEDPERRSDEIRAKTRIP